MCKIYTVVNYERLVYSVKLEVRISRGGQTCQNVSASVYPGVTTGGRGVATPTVPIRALTVSTATASTVLLARTGGIVVGSTPVCLRL